MIPRVCKKNENEVNLKVSVYVKNFIETVFTKFFVVIIGMATSIIIARILGPEGRGEYAVAITISGIGVQLGNLGLHSANTYYIAQNKEIIAPIINNSIIVSFLGGAIVSMIIYPFIIIFDFMQITNTILLFLCLFSIPLGLAYLLLQNILLGINEVQVYNKIEIEAKVFSIVLLLLLIIVNYVNATSIFFITLLTSFIGILLVLLKLNKFVTIKIKFSANIFMNCYFYGIKSYVACLFSFLVLRADLLMVKHFLSLQEAGYYSIALNIGDMLFLFSTTLGTILFPKLSAMKNTREKYLFTHKNLRCFTPFIIALSLISVYTAPLMVEILFGLSYIPAVSAFILLVPGIAILSLNSIYMNFFASTGMPWVTIYSPLLALILNVFLNMKLIPILGVNGAAISSVISYSLMLLISIFYVKLRFNNIND